MIARNIHFTAEDAAPDRKDEATAIPAACALPRLREVTNDPLREYAARPGEVRALPDSVAALILSKSGECFVENHAITASIDGVSRVYSARDSVVIAELNGKKVKVLWYANRRKPDCIHLVTANGHYIETLPVKGEALPFSNDEISRKVFSDAVAHRNRDARHLEELHAPDIAAAAKRAEHNASELASKVREDERMVRIFPASAGGDRPVQLADNIETAPARGRETNFPKADRLCAVEAAVDRARTERAQAVHVDLVKETLRSERAAEPDAADAWA